MQPKALEGLLLVNNDENTLLLFKLFGWIELLDPLYSGVMLPLPRMLAHLGEGKKTYCSIGLDFGNICT